MKLFYLYLCYFTFGWCLSFCGIATQFTMMDNLGFTPVEMSLSFGIISSPWCIKPLYGFISDKYAIFEYGRRRPYISMTSYLATVLYVFMNLFIKDKIWFVVALTCISSLICFSDVCSDSITVELVKTETVKGRTQSNCWIARATGTLIGSISSGIMYTTIGAIGVFRLSAIFPFLISICIWKLPKHEVPKKNLNVLDSLISNMRQQQNLAIIFLFMMIAPDYGDIYTYYLRKELNYTPYDFAWINVSASLSFLLATITFNQFLLKEKFGIVIMVGVFGSSIFKLTQLLVVTNIAPYFYIVLGDGVAESFFGQLTLMPLIVLAAKGCRDGVEGSVYALLMSICNLSNILGNWSGGFLAKLFNVTQTNFDNLIYVMIVGIVLDTIIPFVIILKMFSVFDQYEEIESDHMDHTLEPVDPEILYHTRETSVSLEENKRATLASKRVTWGKQPWWLKKDHTFVHSTEVPSESTEVTSEILDDVP